MSYWVMGDKPASESRACGCGLTLWHRPSYLEYNQTLHPEPLGSEPRVTVCWGEGGVVVRLALNKACLPYESDFFYQSSLVSVEGVKELRGMCREGTMLAEEDPPSRVSLGQVAGRRGDPDFYHVLAGIQCYHSKWLW